VALECEKNAFAEMGRTFVRSKPASSPVHSTSSPPKRDVAEDVPDILARRTRSQSRGTKNFESLEPSKPKQPKTKSGKRDSGIRNLGMTCYANSALQVALSVTSWSQVFAAFVIRAMMSDLFLRLGCHSKALNPGCRSGRGIWNLPGNACFC
jgi:ubiquitin C-terminal hydrolase